VSVGLANVAFLIKLWSSLGKKLFLNVLYKEIKVEVGRNKIHQDYGFFSSHQLALLESCWDGHSQYQIKTQ